jgi:PBSX family phage terminase large subunit
MSPPTKIININLWTPHVNQKKILADKSRYKVIVCGRRFGKTTFCVAHMVQHAMKNPRSLIFYIAPTYKAAKMIAWSMLIQMLDRLPREYKFVAKTNESELYVLFTNGSRIDIKGADNPDALRGVGLNLCIMDEYQDMRPNVFEEIIRPALTDKKGSAIFIGTPKGFNHFYDLYNNALSNPKFYEYAAFKFTSYDNPLVDPVELDKARAATSEDRFAQEYLADFRRYEGLVYKEFDRSLHIFTELPDRPFIEVFAGVDFGYTNPAAIVVIGRDFDNHFWIVEEWYKTGKTTAEIIERCKQLRTRWNINQFYPDPAEPDRIEEMTRAGLACRDVSKDIDNGVDAVRNLFKTNRLKIQHDCENLLYEVETYHYPEKKFGRNEKEQPVKEDDHALDALRYAIYSNWSPIDPNENSEDFSLYKHDFS